MRASWISVEGHAATLEPVDVQHRLDGVEGEVDDEEAGHQPHQRVDRARLAPDELDEDVGDEARADARGDQYVNGMSTMVRNAGIAISRSSQEMPFTCCIMRNPTMTSAGVGGLVGHDRHERRKNVANEEEHAGADAGQAGPRALADA